MASSIPAALDYLVAAVRDLPEAGPPVAVSDGWPVQRSDDEIVIGIDTDDGNSQVGADYAQLSRMEEEEVAVPCVVAVRRGGSDAASAARTAAFGLLDAVRGLVASDRTLGGAVRQGLPARVAGWTMAQTSDAQQAGEGRVCQITFTLTWRHRG
jgi:hypothetical protein